MQTTFSVSNTDVITMLVVKQRKVLQDKEAQLIKQYLELRVKFNEKFKVLYNKRLEKVNKDVISSFEILMKALNPKLKFTIQVGEDDMYLDTRYRGDKDTYTYNQDFLSIYAIFNEEDEDRIVCFNNSGDTHIEIPFKINIKMVIPQELIELDKELIEIRSLLDNETSLKEQMIAKVTENAIKNLPEMQTLVNGVELLQLNN